MKKEVFLAILAFTIAAIVIALGMTAIGNVICPESVDIAALYDISSTAAKVDSKEVTAEKSDTSEKKEVSGELEETPKQSVTAEQTDLQKEDVTASPAEKSEKMIIAKAEKADSIGADIAEEDSDEELIPPDEDIYEKIPETAEEDIYEGIITSETEVISETDTESELPEQETKAVTEASDFKESEEIPPLSAQNNESDVETAEKKRPEETVTPKPTPASPEKISKATSEEIETKEEVAISDQPEEEPESIDETAQKKISEEIVTAEPTPASSENEEISSEIVEQQEETKPVVIRTAEDIAKLTASLKQGEILDLGDGRVAYKVKGGDAFSIICQKVIGTSKTWRKEAEKMGVDYRTIYPGMVLIFETTPKN